MCGARVETDVDQAYFVRMIEKIHSIASFDSIVLRVETHVKFRKVEIFCLFIKALWETLPKGLFLV